METRMKDLMGSRRWALLAAVTVLLALALSLGAGEAFGSPCPDGPRGCTNNSTPSSPSTISVAPYITAVDPQDGATGVSRNTNIKVYFNRSMDDATINGDTLQLWVYNKDCNPYYCSSSSERIPATVYYEGEATLTYVLDPYGSDAGRLPADKEFVVKVTTGVKDIYGKYMASEKVSFFWTAAASAPTVTQVSPTNGATGVARSTNVKVTFSEAMDPASINTSTLQLRYYDVWCPTRYPDPYNPCYFSMHQITAGVSKDAADPSGRTWVIDPEVPLYANKNYMVRVTTGVRDIEDGLQMSSNKEWYFKTGTY